MGKIASFWLTFFVYREILGAFQRVFNEKITFCRLPAEASSTFVPENRK